MPDINLPHSFSGKPRFREAREECAEKSGRWERLPAFAGHCNRYLVQVPNEKIGYVNAILESYEWIARVRTTEIGSGILEIHVPDDWDEVFQEAMGRLSQDLICQFRGWERGASRRVWGMAAERPDGR